MNFDHVQDRVNAAKHCRALLNRMPVDRLMSRIQAIMSLEVAESNALQALWGERP